MAPRSSLLAYGIDAPYVPAAFIVIGLVALVVGIVAGAPWSVVVGVFFLIQAVTFLHTTLRGKHVTWSRLLDDLELQGDEDILDLGCGRGAVLVAASARVPDGSVHGVDVWRSVDQSGNSEATTRANAEAAGTSDRVRLHTGDMRSIPMTDGSVDVVLSSLAIHNLRAEEDRDQALEEVLRVLRPDGRLVIVDIRHGRAYAAHLRSIGAVDVHTGSVGPGFWFGGPWQGASVTTATRPSPV